MQLSGAETSVFATPNRHSPVQSGVPRNLLINGEPVSIVGLWKLDERGAVVDMVIEQT